MDRGISIVFTVLDLDTGDTSLLGHYELPEIPRRGDFIRIEDTSYTVHARKWDVGKAFKKTAYAVGILLQTTLQEDE